MMKRRGDIADVPAEQPEEGTDLEAALEKEPGRVLIVDTEEAEPLPGVEPEEEGEPLFDSELEPDTGAVLLGDTYGTRDLDVVEEEPPPFLEADRVDHLEPEVDWVPPPLEEELAPEPDFVDEMAIEAGEPDMGPEPDLESPPPEPEVMVTEPATPPPPPPPRSTRPVTREVEPRRGGVGWGGVLTIGLLSALAGAALALLVLFALNGSLIYPRNRDRAQDQEISALSGEVSRVQTQLGTVDSRLGDVEGLGTRVDEVVGRVDTLGGDLDTLQGDVASALDEVDAVQGNLEAVATRTAGIDEEVTTLSEDVTEIGEQVGLLEEVARRFDLFLAGLRDLLDQADVVPEDEAVTPSPVVTGSFTVTPLATSTAVATVTPRPDVTVIPLATPTP
jgi:hypothetical protein